VTERTNEELRDEEAAEEAAEEPVIGPRATVLGLFTPHRLFGLTDGVFAIAMTLLALDVRIPEGVEGVKGFNEAAHAFYGDFFVFLVAFGITGRFWLINHRMLARLKAVDEGVLNRSISFLAGISSIPVATAVLFRFGSAPQAVSFAAVLLAATALLSARLWWYMSAPERQLIDPDPDPDARLIRLVHMLYSPVIYLLAIPTAYLLQRLGTDNEHVAWATLTWLLLIVDARFVRLVRWYRARRTA
jgi:uncharacterized membrane protein